MARHKILGFELPTFDKVDSEAQLAENAANAAKLNFSETEKANHSIKFPVDAFPPEARNIIEKLHAHYGYPIDYYASSFLTCAASLLGVAFKARLAYGHEHFPILYMANVGNSSAGKTQALKPFRRVLDSLEKEYYTAWRDSTQSDTPKQRREILLDNSNAEGMLKVMSQNPRGLLMLRDELISWLNAMNQYRSGDDEQLWITTWEGTPYKNTRINTDSNFFIEYLCCSVFGGIQPGIINQMFVSGKDKTGFTARLLFSYPAVTKAQPLNTKNPDPIILEQINKMLRFIHNLPNKVHYAEAQGELSTIESIPIDLNVAAKNRYEKYFNELTNRSNESDDDRVKAMLGKMQSYCLRFALVLEMLNLAGIHTQYNTEFGWIDKDPNDIFITDEWAKGVDILQHEVLITAETIERSIKLCEYYIATHLKVMERISSPASDLSAKVQAWYNALPEDAFRSSIAVEIGIKSKFVSEKTAKTYLKDRVLFKRSVDNTGNVKYVKNY